MIIKCPRCASRYKIDASSVSEEGQFAKCAKCENVFFIRKRPDEEIARLKERKEGKKAPLPTPQVEEKRPAAVTAPQEQPAEMIEPAMEAEKVSMEPIQAPPAERMEEASITADETPTEHFNIPTKTEGPALEKSSGEEIVIQSDDIAALIAANAPKAEPVKEEPAEVSQDDIAALIAANAPQPEPVKEESAGVSQDDIAALIAANAPQPEPVKEEPAGVSQDDIAALIAANAPKPAPVKEEPAGVSQDDIAALIAANAPKAEPVKEEPAEVSQDDIAALIAANAPKPAPVKEEPAGVSQDDIAALIAANAPKPAPVKEELAEVSQDDIAALIAANAPKPAPVKEEPAEVSQDDIAALIAANAPKPAPVKEEPEGVRQDDIAALIAANAPKSAPVKEEPAAIVESAGGQDDIDSLLAAYSPKDSGAKQAASAAPAGQQDEIDALLASVMPGGAGSPKPKAAPGKKEGEIISQSDLDALLMQPAPAAAPVAQAEAQEKEPETYISQDDIDTILGGETMVEEKAATAVAPAEKESDEEGFLTQDTLDALLMEAGSGDVEKAAETLAPALAESPDLELDRILSGGGETGLESLFEETGGAMAAAEPAAAPQKAAQPAPEVSMPAPSFDKTMVIPPPAMIEEEEELPLDRRIQMEHEDEHRAKFQLRMPAFVTAVIGKIMPLLRKIHIPAIKLPFKLPFRIPLIGALPPRAVGILAGAVAAVVIGTGVGGYLFLSGGKAKPVEQAAVETGKAPGAGPAKEAKPEDVKQAVAVKPSGPTVKLGVYLPVDFDAEATRIMNMDVELIFDSDIMAGAVRDRMFFTEVTVEKQIDSFFRDKFYEETVFAQDKLEEYLVQNLKAVEQFAGLKDVKLRNFAVE
ncbi:MAG: zinc-ribbon domain-containing protein [Nitrospinae bacterium]|nr:zinc-ribbon domain-containing protein [Nitrospinota bacterium]